MKLYRQETTFNVVEMIGGMLDVSALQVQRHRDSIKGGLSQWCELCVTSFSFGRQSGHSSGALEYLYRNRHTYMIVHNEATRKRVIANHMGLAERVINAGQSLDAYNIKFKGKSDFDLILDSVPDEIYQRFMMNIATHIHHVRAVCRVGS